MSEKRIYGEWAGCSHGKPEDEARCIQAVYPSGAYYSSQCARKRGFGPGGLYCKQHDPERIAAKEAAKKAKRDARCAEINSAAEDAARRSLRAAACVAACEGVDDPTRGELARLRDQCLTCPKAEVNRE